MPIEIVSTNRADKRMAFALERAGVDKLGPKGRPVSIILGDRKEMLLAAVERAATHRLVHVAGGETFIGMRGSPDHLYRNAITQLSEFHFVANDHAAKNVISMGVPWHHVHVTGLPSLDELVLDAQARWVQALTSRVPRVLLAYHPDPQVSEVKSGDEITRIVAALWHYGRPVLVSMPNSDANSATVCNVLYWALKKNAHWSAIQPFGSNETPGEYRDAAMREAFATYELGVGNSSAFRIEASIYGMPVVEVGHRQAGRLLPHNVLTLPGETDVLALHAAFVRQAGFPHASHPLWANPNGRACERILALLKRLFDC